MTFNGHLWTAKWWSEDDTPGGELLLILTECDYSIGFVGDAGVWTDDGSCANAAAFRQAETPVTAAATAIVHETHAAHSPVTDSGPGAASDTADSAEAKQTPTTSDSGSDSESSSLDASPRALRFMRG